MSELIDALADLPPDLPVVGETESAYYLVTELVRVERVPVNMSDGAFRTVDAVVVR